jgi:hypothetical protein
MPSAPMFSGRGRGALVLKVEQSESEGPPSGEGLTAGQQLGSQEEPWLTSEARHRSRWEEKGGTSVRHRGAPSMTTVKEARGS